VNRSQLYHPRHWPSWLAVAIIRLVVLLPAPTLIRLGTPLGHLLYRTVGRRRRIAYRNLQRAFPDKTSGDIDAIVHSHFQALGIMAMEMLITWWKRSNQIPAKIEITGQEHLQQALAKGKGVLLLSAHFTSLEIGGALLQRDTQFTIHGMYRPHENLVFEAVVKKGRQHWFSEMIARDNVKQMLRSLKKGLIVWYAPDQAYGGRNSIQVPFFGHNVATNPGTSRIARLSGAPVVPYFPIRKSNGLDYELRLLPALDNFPSDDLSHDATMINELIEKIAREYPEQYYWVHRRFKYSDDPIR